MSFLVSCSGGIIKVGTKVKFPIINNIKENCGGNHPKLVKCRSVTKEDEK